MFAQTSSAKRRGKKLAVPELLPSCPSNWTAKSRDASCCWHWIEFIAICYWNIHRVPLHRFQFPNGNALAVNYMRSSAHRVRAYCILSNRINQQSKRVRCIRINNDDMPQWNCERERASIFHREFSSTYRIACQARWIELQIHFTPLHRPFDIWPIFPLQKCKMMMAFHVSRTWPMRFQTIAIAACKLRLCVRDRRHIAHGDAVSAI